jgi:DNA-binding response OmpR family regulator
MPRVLLIDDEDVILQVLGMALRRAGFEVETANSIAAGRALLESKPWEAVLVDKNLPDGFGIELLRESRTLHPFTQFVVITGYASLESAVQALEAGAYDYLIKPFDDVKDVIAKVRRAIDKCELERKNDELSRELAERNKQLQRSVAEITRLRSLVVDEAELAAARAAVWDLGRELAATRETNAVLADLVELAHPGVLHTRPTLLGAVVGAAVEAVSPTARHRRTRILVRSDEKLRAEIDVDRLSPALRHLVRRAVEGSAGGSEVTVICRETDGHPQVVVEDAGDPVPLHSPPRAGSIGVLLCRAVVEAHGGKLIVEQRSGGGISTRMTLPRK